MGPEFREDNQKLPDKQSFPPLYFASNRSSHRGEKCFLKRLKPKLKVESLKFNKNELRTHIKGKL